MKSDFRYGALLFVHPHYGEFSPNRIRCPNCGTTLRVTAKSRLLAVVMLLSSVAGAFIVLTQPQWAPPAWGNLLVLAAAVATYYFAIWPLIVRFKPWSDFQYWLPERRLTGYVVYLLLPVALMVLVLYLAIRFEVGA